MRWRERKGGASLALRDFRRRVNEPPNERPCRANYDLPTTKRLITMLGLATAALAFSAAPGLRPRAAVVRAPMAPQMGVMDFVNGVKVSCRPPLFLVPSSPRQSIFFSAKLSHILHDFRVRRTR